MMTKNLLTIIFLFGIFNDTSIHAQSGSGNQLSAAIKKAQDNHTFFKPFNLFNFSNGDRHTAVLSKETILTPAALQAQLLYAEKPEAITLSIPDENGHVYKLNMLQSHPFSNDFVAGFIENGKRHEQANADLGVHYQGAMEGVEKSFSSVSIFADGTITVLFGDETGNYIVGKLTDRSGNYVFYNDRNLKITSHMPCGVKENNTLPDPVSGAANRGTAVTVCKKVQLYWEIDFQLYTNAGNIATTNSYVASLFNNVQTLYNNDGIAVELKSFYVNVTADPYDGTSSTTGLNTFQAKWNATGNNHGANLAHLITMDGHNNGGLAYVGVSCSPANGYAYSEVYRSVSAVPTYSWDVMVVTHETGHNLGSNHTHWCGWNAGTCGGAIDDCFAPESIPSGCTTCPATNTTGSGTIMSYCHLVTSRGINLANGFGPLPRAKIQSSTTAGACLSSIINATATPSNICNTNDGAVTIALATNNFGVAPISYLWSNSATTQSLSGLSAPGTYTVTIKDGNNCTNSYSSTIITAPKPGNGAAYGGVLPITCASSAMPKVSAAVPTNLSSCQTVAWLRTSTAITTLSGAQTAFNSATATDIIFSDNASLVDAATPAYLRVGRPSTCASAITLYYTPFVSQKAKAANSIITAANSFGNVTGNGGAIIGRLASVPVAATSPTACDLLYAPTTQELVVTVSSYTGRANQLNIQLQNPGTGAALYSVGSLAGNGTYNIPLSGITGGAFQAIYVLVYDFNCTSSTCVASTSTVAATRTVTYPPVAAPTFETACNSGNSVMMSYAPGGNVPLPVSLLSFEGKQLRDANVLTWEAVSETNMNQYELERSDNGKSFAQINRQAAGNKERASYSYSDYVLPAIGFYRLRITELDGTSSYSKTVKLVRDARSETSTAVLYPNPARQQVTIQLNAAQSGGVTIRIADIMGQAIYQNDYNTAKGINEWNVPLASYAKGIYIVTFSEKGGITSTQKLIVQ